MNFEELKAFLESEAGKTPEVAAYLQSLQPIDISAVQSFCETADGKSWLDSIKDKHLQKGLDTWKTNNLSQLLADEIKKRYPDKDPKDIELESLKNEIGKMQTEKQRESLINQAMRLAGEKGLPLNLVSFFVGENEEITQANLKALEDNFNESVQKSLEARLKTEGYVPPNHSGESKTLEDMNMDEYMSFRRTDKLNQKNGGNA